MGKSLMTIGGFSVWARPIIAAPDSTTPGRLMGYRLTGPRNNQKIITVDHLTGQPSAHEMASLALWVESINYTSNKIRARRAV